MRPRIGSLLGSRKQHPGCALFAVLLTAGLAVGGTWGGRQFGAWRHERAAREALQQLHFAEARRHLDLCLRVWPDRLETRLLAAQAARRADDLEAARQHLEVCQKQPGGGDRAALEWALLSAQKGRMASVLDFLRPLAEQDGDESPLVLEALAKGWMRIQRLSDALDCLNRLLERRPDHSVARSLRGEVWLSLDNPERAVEDLEQAVRLGPDSPPVRLQLAEGLYLSGRLREAVAHYEYLRRQQPEHPNVLLGLARCRLDGHELAEAEELLEALLARQPAHIGGLLERGRLALRRGRFDEAEQWLRRAAKGRPISRDIFVLLQRVCEEQGEERESADCLKRLRQIDADEQRASALSAKVEEASGTADTRYELGVTLLRLGRDEEALRWLREALRLDPSHRPARAALADYSARGGPSEPADAPGTREK